MIQNHECLLSTSSLELERRKVARDANFLAFVEYVGGYGHGIVVLAEIAGRNIIDGE